MIYLFLRHCLENELAVVTEKEEGATSASAQARILNLLNIVGGVKGLAKLLIGNLVRHSNPLKSLWSVLFHYYLSF